MEIFNYNIRLHYWGELETGMKMYFLSPEKIIEYCLADKVAMCTDDIYVELSLAGEESYIAFLKKLRKLMTLRNEPVIKAEIENAQLPLIDYPSDYLEIWELETLLRIQKKQDYSVGKYWDLLDEVMYFSHYANWNFLSRSYLNGQILAEVNEPLLTEYIERLINKLQNR